MYIRQPRFATHGALILIGALFISVYIFSLLLPPDNEIRSLVRFHWHRTSSYFQTPLNEQLWIYERSLFPVNFHDEIGILIKTGYGTKNRVISQMKAMGFEGSRAHSVIVVGNFNATLEEDGVAVDVVDVVGPMLDEDDMADMGNEGRALVYKALREEIKSGNDEKAKEIAAESGWDLDALKFIPGLELAHQRAPYKKWWIIMDDDSFLVKSSLVKILSHLDPAKDQYVGNAVGDYKRRFAHGGSAIALSGHTVQHLFDRPDVVLEAKKMSLNETWGDKLMSTTLMRLGIYLNERFTPFFNGEPPRMTKITADNFCLPVASFHGLTNPSEMTHLGNLMADIDIEEPVFRGSVWVHYREPGYRRFGSEPVQQGNHDHVGKVVEKVQTVEGVMSAMDCVSQCDKPWSSCLAWTWDEKTYQCRLAPWFIIGEHSPEGKKSGIHYTHAMDIRQRCTEEKRKADLKAKFSG